MAKYDTVVIGTGSAASAVSMRCPRPENKWQLQTRDPLEALAHWAAATRKKQERPDRKRAQRWPVRLSDDWIGRRIHHLKDEGMLAALRQHWPEYLIEAVGLGTFMISACVFTVLLMHPALPSAHWLVAPVWSRALIGIAMGLTSIALIYSPWGKRSGAHFNPSVTIAFFRLGKITFPDTVFYVVSQFAGAVAGALISTLLLSPWISDARVNYAITSPGPRGAGVALVSEFTISFLLMTAVLVFSNNKKLARFTGIFAGFLVATYITVEAPLSGMSMNPARSFGSALPAHVWKGWWIYFTAPPLGMLAATVTYVKLAGAHSVKCAKLNHGANERCIFRCGYRRSVLESSSERRRELQSGESSTKEEMLQT